MDIPAKYMAYLTTMLIVLVTLYLISHYFKDSGPTFGINYVGTVTTV